MRILNSALATGVLLFAVQLQARCQQDTLPPVTVTATTNIEKAVTRSFEQSFPDALDAQWFRASKQYLVRFMNDDQQNSALLKKDGSIVYHIAYGWEKDLPADVRMIVRKQYPDQTISKVIRVEEKDRKIWVITVEDRKKLILVRIENEELEEVGNFDKSR